MNYDSGNDQGSVVIYAAASDTSSGSMTKVKGVTFTMSESSGVVSLKAGSTTVSTLPVSSYSSGWAAAYAKVSVPTSTNTGSSISIGVPPSTVDGTTATYTYSVSADKNYAYIKYGTTTVARVSNGQYSAGWAAAYGKVSVPTSSNTGGSISIGVPPSTVDGTTSTYTYSVSVDDSYAYIKYGSTTVARASNSGYLNGWNAACSSTNLAFSYSYSSNYFDVKYPKSNGGNESVRFWLVDDSSTHVVNCWLGNASGGTSSVVAKVGYSYPSHSAVLTRATTSVSSSGASTGPGKLYLYNSTNNTYQNSGPSSNRYWYYSTTGITSGTTVYY